MDTSLPMDFEIVEEEMVPLMAEDVAYAVDDSNETTVFVQQGDFIVPIRGRTVVLQNEEGIFHHYLINDNEVDNDSETGKPIVFYTNEENLNGDVNNEDVAPYTYILEDATQSDEVKDEEILMNQDEMDSICQYAILKDGKLHLQRVDVNDSQNIENNQEKLQEQIDALQECITLDESTCDTIDLDKITGKNLLTGQTVTLDHYFDKLQKRLNFENACDVAKSKGAINDSLINKKVTIGKMANGKKMVGKILHVQTGENCDKTNENKVHPNIIIKKQMVTQENFDLNIGKTLAGLMELETVHHRLQNKYLVVKLVDKVYNSTSDNFSKTISYVRGHMELNNDNWSFVLHNNKKEDEDESESLIEDIDEQTISLTILTVIDRDGKKSMRVNLNPQQTQIKCQICGKEFKTSQQINKHINSTHVGDKWLSCELCGKNFTNDTMMQRHKKIHSCQKWHQCSKCPKSFNTAGSLKRHLSVHDPSLRPLECTLCSQRFTDESSLRKHLLIHTGIKAYACDICTRAFRNRGDLNFHRRIHDPIKLFSCEVCGRAFSRHSNMVRHAEIHRGSGVLHRCEICGCSYSFISSLTRHIVQKHLSEEQVEGDAITIDHIKQSAEETTDEVKPTDNEIDKLNEEK